VRWNTADTSSTVLSVTVRRGFGDQAWDLAQNGDIAALERAAELHLRHATGVEYEGHRARAFAFAVEGRAGEALARLNEGWSDEWPTPAAYAADVARIHFLAGDCAAALTALQLDLRALEHIDGVTEFAVTCARRDPSVRRRALRVALRGTRGFDKLRAVAAVLSARPASAGDPQHDLPELSS
jgi:hypothetical protein